MKLLKSLQPLPALALALLLNPAARAEPDRVDRVLAAAEMRVCVWPDYDGSSYHNPQTQQLTGLGVDMARAFDPIVAAP